MQNSRRQREHLFPRKCIDWQQLGVCYSPHHEPLWQRFTSAGEAVEQSGAFSTDMDKSNTNIDPGGLPKIISEQFNIQILCFFPLSITIKSANHFDLGISEAGLRKVQ